MELSEQKMEFWISLNNVRMEYLTGTESQTTTSRIWHICKADVKECNWVFHEHTKLAMLTLDLLPTLYSPRVSPHHGALPTSVDSGLPSIMSQWEGVPHSSRWGGTPIPGQDGGYPHHLGHVLGQDRGDTVGGVYANWNSIACTSYTAGGMPLAFTQEDFLVFRKFVNVVWLSASSSSW